MNYMVGTPEVPAGVCRLRGLEEVPDDEELLYGVSRIQGFPTEAHFVMDKKYPKDIKLADVLRNSSLALVISEKLKAFLQDITGALKNNELLEVGIVNHKGREEKDRYFILHQVKHPKGIDEQKTVGDRSSVDPETYVGIDTIVLDEKKLDPDVMIFRLAQIPKVVIFRCELAEKLSKAKFTGIKFTDIDRYAF